MKNIQVTCLLALLMVASGSIGASAQGYAFTYQGLLNSGGSNATGLYDMSFALYDSATNGQLVGTPVTVGSVPVNNGLFTATVNFGSIILTGAFRWLEIGVRTNGTILFNTLAPRQQLTATPYSILAGAVVPGSITSLSSPGGGPVNALTVSSNGNVGIGTNAPGAKLDVNGTIRTKVLEITGADLAEKFPTSDKVEPGMVVAIDPHNPGKLCRARGSYNRRVAGVVSGANDFSVGAVLGNLPGHEDAPPVALSGRVYVWCDASTGSIQPGDLLTTSDTPGHAMRAAEHEQAQGAILGKAMTSLKSGKGMVLVLVTLQ